MKYDQTIITPKGLAVHIRNGVASDGSAVLENFNLAHAETDYLLSAAFFEERFSDLVRSIKCYFVLSILKPSNVPRFFEFGIPIRAEIGLML